VLIDCDASQLEWRVGAYLSQDPVMIKEIRDGIDIHMDNAMRLFGDPEQRTISKVISFRFSN
jgi:DNA polymerase I-like protein with 3'-5' exonuclease and polymerase domains